MTDDAIIFCIFQMLHLGKDYPTGSEAFRKKLHESFIKNKDVTNENEIRRCILYGKYMKREIEALYRLKKYRSMKNRYYDN